MGGGMVAGYRTMAVLCLMLALTVPATADHALDDRGLLAHWTFNETSGDLRDWSGQGLDGTTYGDIQRGVDGANSSTAYRFDGSDDYVWIDDPDELTAAREAVTLEMWFNPSTITPPDTVWVFKESNVALYGFHVLEGGVRFYVDTEEDGGKWGSVFTELPAVGEWYHVVGTYNGSATRLYVDGELVDSTQQEGLINEKHSDGPVIGADEHADNFFTGDMDDFRIYNRSLTPEEVSSHYEDPPGWHPPDTPTENDTSDEDTADNTTTSNETDDGTADNGTTTDNETYSGDNTTTDGSGDGSLFDGSNETDGSSGTSTEDMTGSNDTTANTTSDGTMDGPENETDTPTENDTSDEDASSGISIRPDRLGFRANTGETVTRRLSVTNRDSGQVQVSLSRIGVSFGQIEERTFWVAPGGSAEASVMFDLQDIGPGQYSGRIRVEAANAVYSVPVRALVSRGNVSQGEVSIGMDVPADAGAEGFVMGDIRLEGGPSPIEATVMSRVYHRGETVFAQAYNTSLVAGDESRLTAPVSDLGPGEYTWNVTVETPYESVTAGRSFGIAGDEPDRPGPAEQDRQEDHMIPLLVLLFFVLLGAGGYVARNRDISVTGLWKTAAVALCLLAFAMPATATHDVDDDRILGFWTFDETSGDLLDQSGNGLDGTLYGGIDRGVEGVNNSTAYRFDGTDDRIAIADPDGLSEADDTVSVEAWFNPATVTPAELMYIYQQDGGSMYGLFVSDDDIGFYINTSRDGGGWQAEDYSLAEPDRWYHVVGTYDGSTTRLYLDGKLEDSQERGGSINEGGDTDPVIGAKEDQTQFFEGALDELRVYDRVLNASTVEQHYEDPPGWHPEPMETSDDTQTNDSTEDTTDNTTDDQTSDNETTGDETTTDNETSDGSDNETTADGGTTNETSDDGSLFTGGNGTDQQTDGGVGSNTSTDNGTVAGNGSTTDQSPENTSISNGSTTDEPRQGISIGPDRFGFSTATGETVTRSVAVRNDGSDPMTIRIAVDALPFGMVEEPQFTLAGGETRQVPVRFDLGDVAAGEYTGRVRVETSNAVHSVPVRVLVTEEDVGGVVVLIDVDMPDELGGFLSGTIELEQGPSPLAASVTSRVERGGETVFSQGYNTSLTTDGPSRLRVPLDGLGRDIYTWNITVRTPYDTFSVEKAFTAPGRRGTTGEGATGRTRDSGRSFPVSSVIPIFLALVIAGVLGWKKEGIRVRAGNPFG